MDSWIQLTAGLAWWTAVFILTYTYLGYPVSIWFLSIFRRRLPPPATGAITFSVVLVAHNEEKHLPARLANLRQMAPAASDIIVVDDGSTDATAEIVGRAMAEDNRLRLIKFEQRSGKAAGLKAGAGAAQGEIILLTDARQVFFRETVPALLRHFADARIGAVSGSLELAGAADAVGGGLNFYWRFEKLLRDWESKWDSAIGCTGAVYAARAELLRKVELPADTILDDVVIPMQIALRGYRVLFEPAARAFDPLRCAADAELRRKARTLAGNIQMLLRYPGWLLPWRNRLWWQLLAHKYLRLLTPFALALLLGASLLLWRSPYYGPILLAQILFYVAAALGLKWRALLRYRLFSLPAGLLFFAFLPLRGLRYYLVNRRSCGW